METRLDYAYVTPDRTWLFCWEHKLTSISSHKLPTLFPIKEIEDEITINPFRKMRISIKTPKVLPVVMNQSEVQKIGELR